MTGNVKFYAASEIPTPEKVNECKMIKRRKKYVF
jgi:hypothetical protein